MVPLIDIQVFIAVQLVFRPDEQVLQHELQQQKTEEDPSVFGYRHGMAFKVVAQAYERVWDWPVLR